MSSVQGTGILAEGSDRKAMGGLYEGAVMQCCQDRLATIRVWRWRQHGKQPSATRRYPVSPTAGLDTRSACDVTASTQPSRFPP